MAGKGGGESGGGDDARYLIFFLLIIGTGWVVWTLMKPQFLWVTLGGDIIQYKALQLLGLLDAPGNTVLKQLQDVRDALFRVEGKPYLERITWSSFVSIQTDIGQRLKWFWIFTGVALSTLVLFKMKGDGFKKQYSLTGRSNISVFRFMGMRINNKLLKFLIYWTMTILFLRKLTVTNNKEWINTGASFAMYQARHWREALTGAVFSPEDNEPNMRPQLTPPEWMREHKISLKNGDMDMPAAIKALKLQAGDNWAGLKSASLHVQAIMIMSALNVKRDKGLNDLRARLTECYVLRPGAVKKEVPALLAPYMSNARIVEKIESKAALHAFTNTACIGVYGWGGPIEAWGGKGGVLSSSLFLWLKRVDRPLWYALNNVGRRQYHVEGAGAVCHYFVERLYRGPVSSSPTVDNALQGIMKYLSENNITDLDEHFSSLSPDDQF